jgi:hypothetical protein
MTDFRKPAASSESRRAEERARSGEQLRVQMSALENETTELTQNLSNLRAFAAAAQDRAMQAIRGGDDCAAREFLMEQGGYLEKAVLIEADLKVLRAILDECYQFVAELSKSPRQDQQP